MQQEWNKRACHELTCSLIKDMEGIGAVRAAWQELYNKESSPSINSHIDRYISVLETERYREALPYILLLKKSEKLEAMLIGRIENRDIECKLGYRVVFRPRLRCLTIVYGGMLGDQSEHNCRAIVRQLLATLGSGEVDVVLMNQLRTDTELFRLSKEMSGFLTAGHFVKVQQHWRMSIPADMECFYQRRSRKHRKHLKQYSKKLERTFQGQIRVVTYCKESDVYDVVSAASHISSRTYKAGLGCAMVDSLDTRRLLSEAARQGWLRTYVLYINGEPGAYRSVLHHGRIMWGDGIGFDPKWSSFRIGTVLFLRVIEDVCKNNLADYYDFGFGDAEYKTSYGDHVWTEASVYIFALRPYPIAVNMVQSLTGGTALLLNWLSDKVGLTRLLKRSWRNKLQKS